MVSPRMATERIAAKFAFEEMEELVRGYDLARRGRRNDGWTATGTSANAEIGPAALLVRSRSRDLVRNNPFAAKIVRTMETNVVGTGVVPRAGLKDKKEKQRAKDWWDWFSDDVDPEGLLDFYGLQALGIRTMTESGQALVQYLPRPSNWNLKVPLQARVLEPDYIDLDKSLALEDGGFIMQGVQFDRHGRREGYWLFDQHPGDQAPLIRRVYHSTFVPAATIQPMFEVLRPGQVHGVSILAPAAMKLRDIADLDEARLVKKKIEACFVAFVKRGSKGGTPLTGKSTKDKSGNRVETMRPGTINFMDADEEVTFGQPSGSEGDVEYLKMSLHAAAAGAGVAYYQMTGDLTGANYSSLRAGKAEFWGYTDVLQQRQVIGQLGRGAWSRVDALAMALGERQVSIPRAVWSPPERILVDPGKDGAATDAAIRAGRKSLPQAVAATGRDPDEHFEEIAEANAALDAAGIVLDTDPRKVSRAGLTQARPDGSVLPPLTGSDEDSDEGNSENDSKDKKD